MFCCLITFSPALLRSATLTMTPDSIPKLFSQLCDVFPQLDSHSYIELGQDIRDLLSEFQCLGPHLPSSEDSSFIPHRHLIWALVDSKGNLRRYVVIRSNILPDSKFSDFGDPRHNKDIGPPYVGRSANSRQCQSS